MKRILLSFCLFSLLFFLGEGEVMAVHGGGQQQMMEALFRRLDEEEVSHLYALLSESYTVGYYEVLDGFSHEKEVARLRATARWNLRRMQNDAKYHSIFQKAQGGGRYLTQYISHWSQRGKEHAHARNLVNEVRGVLMSGDILYEIPAEKETFSVAIGFITGAITADDFGRIAFATVLFFVAIAMVIGFVGARRYPHIRAFKQIRYLLDC